MELHISDLHLGVENREETRITLAKVAQFLDQNKSIERVILNGDGIAGYLQRSNPDWQSVKDAMFEPLGDYLSDEDSRVEFAYLLGNCDNPHHSAEFGLQDKRGDRYTDHKNGVLTFHGHQLEPNKQLLIADAVLHAVGSISVSGRNALEKILPGHLFDRSTSMELMKLCIKNDPAVHSKLHTLDSTTHQSNTALNSRIDIVLKRMPWIQKLKDRFILDVLKDVYLRSLITLSSALVEEGVIEKPHTISFGHIHSPDCMYSAEELRKRGISATHMPEYVVNTGTGVPLLQENGGTNQAHFVVIDNAGNPSLWRSFDASHPDRPPYKVR